MRWFYSSGRGSDYDCFGAEVTPEAFVRELDIAAIDAMLRCEHGHRLHGPVADWTDALDSGFGVRLDPQHVMNDAVRATIRGLPADAPHIDLGMFGHVKLMFSYFTRPEIPLTVLDDGRIVPAVPYMVAVFDGDLDGPASGVLGGLMGGVVFDGRGGIDTERFERLVDAAGDMIGMPMSLTDFANTDVSDFSGFPKENAGDVRMAEEVFRTLAPGVLSHARAIMNEHPLRSGWREMNRYLASIYAAVDFCARNRSAGHSPEAVGISLMEYLDACQGRQGYGPWCLEKSSGGLLMPPTRFDGLAVEAPGVYRAISRTVMDAGFVAYNSDPKRFDIEGPAMADDVISEVAAACDGIAGLAAMPGEIVREDLLDSVPRMRAVRAAMDGLVREVLKLKRYSDRAMADYRRCNALARMVFGDE